MKIIKNELLWPPESLVFEMLLCCESSSFSSLCCSPGFQRGVPLPSRRRVAWLEPDGSFTSGTSGPHGAAGLCAHVAVGAEPL